MDSIPRMSRLLLAAFALSLAACNGNASLSGAAPIGPLVPDLKPLAPSNAPIMSLRRRSGASGKIKHVVIIVQENRSLNNLFNGFPGAKTVKYGYDTSNNKIALVPVGLETTWDIDHSSTSFFQACNGTGSIPGTDCRMNGFNQEWVGCGHGYGPKCPNSTPMYAYVPHTETKPYFAMAKQYVLGDEMYASNFDASSFTSHQYIISGQSQSSVDFPWGPWGCPGGSGDKINMVGQQRQIPTGTEVVCWDPTTLGDELDQAGISWGYYASQVNGDGGIWSAYQAIRHVYYGSDWKNDVLSPQTTFFNDISNGKMRSVSWITPTCENSDHAGCGSKTGPSWVASLVNAVGESQYWDSTVIFIFWDEYGGWYDSEPPAYADYDGLGMRMPLLIVSPYARKGYVSHVHYEHGSMLKFIEDLFGLGRLAASDARANSPETDAFNWKKKPRKFKAIPTTFDKRYFLNQPLDLRPPDTQ